MFGWRRRDRYAAAAATAPLVPVGDSGSTPDGGPEPVGPVPDPTPSHGGWFSGWLDGGQHQGSHVLNDGGGLGGFGGFDGGGFGGGGDGGGGGGY
jgi:hypothetical protein